MKGEIAMKEVQYINNYPICDAEARNQLANKEDKGHTHEEYATSAEVQQIFNSIDINDFDMSDFATKEDVEDAVANIVIPEVDLSDYALKADIPTKVSQLENDAEFISYYDLCLKDENGDFVVDENGDHILENFITRTEAQEMIDEAVLGLEGNETPVDLSIYQTKTDDTLSTTDKTIVGAINELFQNANNGKEIIADVIGGELQSSDTFSAMGTKIDNMSTTLSEFIVDKGGTVIGGENLSELLEILYTAVDIQFSDEVIEIPVEDFTVSGLDLENSISLILNNTSNTVTGYLYGTYTPANSTDIVTVQSDQTSIVSAIVTKQEQGEFIIQVTGYQIGSTSLTLTMGDITKIITVRVISEETGVTLNYETDQILTGMYRSMVLKNDGSVWSCGNYTQGMLGYEDHDYGNVKAFVQATQPADNIKALIGGNDYSILFKTDGTFSGAGDNEFYQLGKTSNTYDNLTFADISTIDDIAQMHTDGSRTFVIKNDGTLWGIGVNTSGQLGLGSGFGNCTTWTQVTTNISDIKTLFCGNDYTFLLKNDGTLWATGDNSQGQLGLGDTTEVNIFTEVTSVVVDISDIKTISCGGNHVFIMSNDGTLYTTGNNTYGQLGLGGFSNMPYFVDVPNIDNVKKVSCGDTHTAILKNDGTVWVCGGNECGQLGLGNTDNQSAFVQVSMNADDAIDIVCGGDCTFIIKSDGSVWSCGDNIYGQLGLNSDATTILTFTETNVNINE